MGSWSSQEGVQRQVMGVDLGPLTQVSRKEIAHWGSVEMFSNNHPQLPSAQALSPGRCSSLDGCRSQFRVTKSEPFLVHWIALVRSQDSPVGNSLVAQQLRICLAMQGMQVRSQSGNWDSTCHGAAKPECCNYRSPCAATRESVCLNKRSRVPRLRPDAAPTPQKTARFI